MIVLEADQASAAPHAAAAVRQAFSAACGALLQQLAEANRRLEFCPPIAFVAGGFAAARFHTEAAASQLRLGDRSGTQRLAQLLAFAPVLVPFEVSFGALWGAHAAPGLCSTYAAAALLQPPAQPPPSDCAPGRPSHRIVSSCCSVSLLPSDRRQQRPMQQRRWQRAPTGTLAWTWAALMLRVLSPSGGTSSWRTAFSALAVPPSDSGAACASSM